MPNATLCGLALSGLLQVGGYIIRIQNTAQNIFQLKIITKKKLLIYYFGYTYTHVFQLVKVLIQ